ncbi:MAG TPA: hypothetical protein PLH94_04365 [Fimbriimonadaceae bacterium]|nr:hypothetical protein [Fimbriimonadaceae bacterium]
MKLFRPHVHAARVRTKELDGRVERWLKDEQERYDWQAEELSLIRTVPGRPYETTQTFPFRG